MKKIVGFLLMVAAFCSTGFSEIKCLKYSGLSDEDLIRCVYYDDEYFTEDYTIGLDKPIIYFEGLDYILKWAGETYFDKKHDQKLIEMVLPILKKYKYAVGYDENFCYEYFLTSKNKIFFRWWVVTE